jgi:O-glycosyl hydrolase
MKRVCIFSFTMILIFSGCYANKNIKDETMEKITVINGAVPVYSFILPEGDVFGDYSHISAEFLVDAENYGKQARARAYGAYPFEFFSNSGDAFFLDFGSGDTDKNGPYLVSNVAGSNSDLDPISGGAGPNAWFKLDFPLHGKRHQNYNPANFPDENSGGEFYFAVGLGTGDASNSFTYYVKDVTLWGKDGKKIASQGSGFDAPAFAGYASGIPELRRKPVAAVEASAVIKEPVGPVKIRVDSRQRYQQVRGVGGMSDAWSSPALTEEDIAALYGPDGMGYNIFRIIIYHDPDRWGELLPVAKKAQSYGATILASPWTPPLELKSNNSNIGGHLLPEHYAKYAEHLNSFIKYMADNGVTIDVVSFQNEPDVKVSYDSCDWSPGQMLDFVKNYGRLLGDVKIIPGESFQFKREFTDPLLNDPAALANFDIIGGHIYGGGLAAYPLAAQKGKEVWMTEHLFNTHGNYPFDSTWKAAMTVAKEIHYCMAADFNAYIWWYLKRFYGMIGDGEHGSEAGEVSRRGQVMSHYAKYASGKQRIEAKTTGNRNILVSAYESDSDISMVLINTGNTPSKAKIALPAKVKDVEGVQSSENAVMQITQVPLGLGKKSAALLLAPMSIVSLRFEK